MLVSAGNTKQRGVLLTEALVALSIAMVVLGGALTVYFLLQKHQRLLHNRTVLVESMRAAMNDMATDIRRAGYWYTNTPDFDASTNPFMQTSTDIQVNTAGDCILLSYDADGDGAIPAAGVGDDERYAFRLFQNKVQMRRSHANFNCTSASTNWDDLTDSQSVIISALQFTTNDATLTNTSGTVRIRRITITMTGYPVGETGYTRTMTQTVRVRNDYVLRN